MARIVEEIQGIIEQTHNGGFRLNGEWYNISQYASPRPVVPPVGTYVTVGLDKAGYVREITPANGLSEVPESPQRSVSTRDKHITRMACLNTATSILATRGAIADEMDVLLLAEALETWVTRD
jgi:hypothetical protein